jgi:nitroimidazol reductase NimA-like FMN-containing flavoprotein (pyridoxamine 5'-phosphate oxidase superfamily)
MMHEMRRRDRALSEAEARAILAKADHGFLATVGEDGWPYGVPVNHVLSGDQLYFHGALTGHKLQNLAHEERVSFSVVTLAEVLPEQASTRYESAILFGRAEVVTDPGERHEALELLAQRFCVGFLPQAGDMIRKDGPRTAVVRIRIERITGKSNRGKDATEA